ncbi:MAG TPA: hypothetical protein VM618_10670 [Acidimicrobiia bacterium]|nr:hypothetical protein [Acidimicrobiia bacterium]
MRRVSLIALVLAAAAAAASVGSPANDDQRNERQGSTRPPLLSTTTLVIPGDDGFATRVHPGSWRLADVDHTGRRLVIQVGFGGCTRFQRAEVEESDETVRIVAVMETTVLPPPDPDGLSVACTSELGVREVEVHLQQPLGRRTLLGECDGGAPACDALPRR